METEERLTNEDPGLLSLTGRQCLEAMGNAFFSACQAPARVVVPVPARTRVPDTAEPDALEPAQ
jgi:hypothetical protein